VLPEGCLPEGYLPEGPAVPSPFPGVLKWDYPFLNPDGHDIFANQTPPCKLVKRGTKLKLQCLAPVWSLALCRQDSVCEVT